MPRRTTSDQSDRQYTTNEVADLLFLSLRQLQWWDEKALVKPRHNRHRRLYSGTQLRQLSVINTLRKSGISIQRIRQFMMTSEFVRLLRNQFSIVLMDARGTIHIRDSWVEFEMLVSKKSHSITVAVVKHA